MLTHPAKASANTVDTRVAGVAAGTLILLLALFSIVRPEMMDITMVHTLISALGL